MYQQIDGVAMSSPLDSVFGFVGLYEQLLFKKTSKPLFYFRYVDDIFAIFSNETECNQFLQKLNSLHLSLVLLQKRN